MIYKINILFLKTNNLCHLSDIATQFKVDKSDIVRHIYKLAVSLKDDTEMKEPEEHIDNIKVRRDFFQKNFDLKIGLQRTDVNSAEVLKNSCPVCGYLTLDKRNIFDICGICFWEDDGIDDFEENEESGPNHMTLKEGRLIFQDAKSKLLNTKFNDNKLMETLKNSFIKLDNFIIQNNSINEIVKLQNEILDLLTENKIYGIEKLFNK